MNKKVLKALRSRIDAVRMDAEELQRENMLKLNKEIDRKKPDENKMRTLGRIDDTLELVLSSLDDAFNIMKDIAK